MNKYSTIIVKEQGNVLSLQINRPQVRNALNTEFWKELAKVIKSINSDCQQNVLLITGDEKAFSSGADLKESKGRTHKEYETHLLLTQEVSQRLFSLKIPTIAAISGYALGAGLELSLACDIRIASKCATLGFPEAKVSSSVTGATLRLLPDLVGFAKARELLFSAQNISAQEAHRIGLVQRLSSTESLLNDALELAKLISANSQQSIRGLKTGLNRSQLGESMVHLMQYEVSACLKAIKEDERAKAIEKY